MEAMEFLRLVLASIPGLLLMCGAGFLPIFIFLVVSHNRQKSRVSFLAPLLEKAGFKPVSFRNWFFWISNYLYQTSGGRFCVSVESLGGFENEVRLVCFNIYLPHPSRFLICSPLISKHHMDTLLYDFLVYDRWHKTTLDTLTPHQLQVVCDRGNADRIRQRLEQPELQQLFMLLRQIKEEFYILSQRENYLIIAFVIQPSSDQHGAYWLHFVRQFSGAFCYRIG